MLQLVPNAEHRFLREVELNGYVPKTTARRSDGSKGRESRVSSVEATDTKQQRNGQTLKYGVQDDNEG
ncbi:MAG TPA: hypothetical protein VFY66_03505, partial [Anaerolineales bacterium]|nr:hypothetical protein [Anaerolineales bacterium]